MFILVDSNYPVVLMENLNNTKPFPMTSQEKQQENSAKAPEVPKDDRPKIEVNYQEQSSLKGDLLELTTKDSPDRNLFSQL
jgi:hypothetical protein